MDKMHDRVCQGSIFGFLPAELHISDVSLSKQKTLMMVISIHSESDPIKPRASAAWLNSVWGLG